MEIDEGAVAKAIRFGGHEAIARIEGRIETLESGEFQGRILRLEARIETLESDVDEQTRKRWELEQRIETLEAEERRARAKAYAAERQRSKWVFERMRKLEQQVQALQEVQA